MDIRHGVLGGFLVACVKAFGDHMIPLGRRRENVDVLKRRIESRKSNHQSYADLERRLVLETCRILRGRKRKCAS